jgi:hypothetical protein
MSSELDIYKQNRISDLKSIFNANVLRLYNFLSINIRAIQNSRLATQSKQQQMNNQVNIYYSNVASLKTALDKSILNIQNLTLPKSVNILPANTNILSENKKALLIGINYTGTSNELYGCINDVNSIKERIAKEGFTNINILTDLTAKKANRANILEEFKNLLVNSKQGDLLFFLYSGHGSYILDKNGDETDGYDEMIVSCDLQPVLDDELKNIIQANLKTGVTLFAMFDSCFSGSVLDLKYQYMDSLNYDKYTENAKELETLGNVFMISGCTDQQTSADAFFNNKPNGAMTWSLLESLKQKPVCNWRELVINMRTLLKTSNFEQIPQFSCGKFENIDTPVFI